MNHAPITIILSIASSEVDSPTLGAIKRSFSEALGRETIVVVESSAAPPGDEALRSRAESAHAQAIARVEWQGRHERAWIHFYRSDLHTFSDRELRFSSSDAPEERGRAVGLSMIALIPELSVRGEAAPPSAPSTTASATPPPIASKVEPLASIVPSEKTLPPEQSAAARQNSPGASAVVPAGERAAERNFAFDVVAVALTPIGAKEGTGAGGGAGLRLPLGAEFHLRSAIAVWLGEISAAQATSTSFSAALGVGWHVAPFAASGFTVGVRADGLAVHEALAHFSSDDEEPVHQSRWIPAVDAAVELALPIPPSKFVFVSMAAGGLLVFGKTEVYVHQLPMATIPAFRLFFEPGIRIRF